MDIHGKEFEDLSAKTGKRRRFITVISYFNHIKAVFKKFFGINTDELC
jgi:hypothetical protein